MHRIQEGVEFAEPEYNPKRCFYERRPSRLTASGPSQTAIARPQSGCVSLARVKAPPKSPPKGVARARPFFPARRPRDKSTRRRASAPQSLTSLRSRDAVCRGSASIPGTAGLGRGKNVPVSSSGRIAQPNCYQSRPVSSLPDV